MRRRVLVSLLSFFAAVCAFAASPSEPAFLKIATVAVSDSAHDLFKSPIAVAVDRRTGNLVVADRMHHRIVLVTPSGHVLSLAGNGSPGRMDGAGAAAQFKEPSGVAVDAMRGVVYVSDTGNHLIRTVTFDGMVGTLAGSGRPDDQDGAGTQAGFKQPRGIAVDAAGLIYVADTGNSRIRRVTPAGVVTTIAGDTHDGLADGRAAVAQFKQPEGISVASDGAIYIADTKNNVVRRLRDGVVTTIAGTGKGGTNNGAGNIAEFNEPSGITGDEAGNLYVADAQGHSIRRLAMSGAVVVSTLTGSKAGFGDGSLATGLFREPRGVAFAGALYVADSGNDALRRIDAEVRIESVDPHFGAAAGGTELHVIGSGFVPGATSVTFGNTAAASISYVTSSELLVTTPSLDAAIFDVTVTTPGGSATLPAAFATIPPPTIATVSPRKGATAGGELVTITGTNFTNGTTVKFGGVAATTVAVLNSNSLTARDPANAAGIADVTVTTGGGTATRFAAFTYFAPPAIANFSPTQGAAATVVTINGANFDSDIAGDVVLFGSAQAVVTAASQTTLIVIVPNGATTGRINVMTAGGTAVSPTEFSTTTYASLEITAPVDAFEQGDTVPFNAIARWLNGSAADVSSLATWTTSDANVAVVANGRVTGRAVGTATITATLSSFTATKTFAVRAVTTPVVLPSAIDQTVVQPFADTIRFLYSGTNAVQTGVNPGTINDDRVATIRGRVHARDGAPVPGVEITVAGHDDFGHTFTRVDGTFDLAINGGGSITLVYRKAAWLEVQRLVTAQWNDQKTVDDVVLVPFDQAVGIVTMGNTATQTARATKAGDIDGERTATLILPSNESATVTMADGTTTTPSALHLRATEYTVDVTGPNAMPASLPTMSAYTYCVELSADEAPGGTVQFSKPLSFYVENFLALPVGTAVPSGYYDRSKHSWIGSNNARVIRIVAVAGGIATIDTNGDGIAETDSALALIGFDVGERQALATTYSAGQTLWRMRFNHFTPWDLNFAVKSPSDARGPKGKAKRKIGKAWGKCKTFGWSVVDCADQSLGELIPLQGTPYALEYNSSRAGRTQYSADIELSGNSIPASLKRIELQVTIAGRAELFSFGPQPNLTYTYTWDGTDEFGRKVNGARKADVKVTYVYSMVYGGPTSDPGWNFPTDIIAAAIRRAGDYRLSETTELFLGHFDTGNAGFGGWSFSGQRLYDGIGRTLYEPGGNERSSDPQQTHETEIRNTSITASGTTPDLFTMAAAPDGSIYFTDKYRIKQRTADGGVFTVAGSTSSGFTPDGLDAAGNLANPWQIATGPDGTLYVIDGTRIRAIVNGRWVTVAGTDVYEPGGTYSLPEGVVATSRPITAWSLAVGVEGALYVGGLSRIYKIDPDKTIHTVGGGGTNGAFVDGSSAFTAKLGTVYGIAVAPDGTIYYANDSIVARVTTDGRIFRVPGTFVQPHGVAVSSDGTLLVADVNGFKVWEVTPDGTTRTFAGNGTFSRSDAAPPMGMARSVAALPWEVKVAPDGSVWVLDLGYETLRHAGPVFPPSRTANATVVPSEGGGLAYVFERGRHTRTVNALNGVTVETFGYDGDGNLASVSNVDGLVTRIEHDAFGNPTAVVAPNGQRTTLAISGGQLRSITDPFGASYSFDYNAMGLLAKLVDRRGGLHQFTYDDDGLLIRDDDPVGGFIALGRIGDGPNFAVSRSSAEGRTQSISAADDGSGSTSQTSIGSVGLAMMSTSYGATDSVTSPALRINVLRSADFRFGMLAPIASASVITGSRTLQLSRSRTATLSSADNYLSPTSVTAATTINSRTWTSTYDSATRVLTSRTPAGRETTATLDAKGRPFATRAPLVADAITTYDDRGRVISLKAGARTTLFSYDGFDRVSSITDPLQRTVGFSYDDANRLVSKTLPDGRVITYSRDAAGNITSVTPPSRPAHLFAFTGIDFLERSTLPGGDATSYRYNRDRQVTLITRPDRTLISSGYDAAGRLSTVSAASGAVVLSYSASTGLIDSMTASSGVSTRYTYDGFLPTAISSSGLVNGTISIAYDGDLRVTSKIVGDSAAITYAYDADGLLTAVGAELINRDAASGRVIGTTSGVINDLRTYDEFSQVSEYAARLSASPLFKQHYTRDAAGRITAIDETSGTTTLTRAFSYDAAGRLVSVKENGAIVATYSYDENSNRVTRNSNVGTESGTYDDLDRVTSYAGSTFTYTTNGEIASKKSAFGSTSFAYDAYGNLTGVTLPGGRVITYVLDSRQRRVAKKVDGVITQKFLYGDGLRPIAELAADDSVRYQFLYAERRNVPSLIVGTSTTYRVISDHLGSPRGIVDIATGTTAEYLTYDEFGNVTTDTNPGLQPFGYAGGLYDPDTHLLHFGARDYDATLGRFLTRDPLGLGGGQSNVYDYAANDPINLADPTGLLIGDEAGAEAQAFYVDILTDPTASTTAKVIAGVVGAIATLWTPCTSHATLLTLLTASAVELSPAYAAVTDTAVVTGATAAAETGTSSAAGVTVLGQYPEYVQMAQELGANYLNIPSEQWAAMNAAERWGTNQQFLDQAIARGDVFRLSTEVTSANPAGSYVRELIYMHDQGFEVAADGTQLVRAMAPR